MNKFLLEEGIGCLYLWRKVKQGYLLAYYKLTNECWTKTKAVDVVPVADPRNDTNNPEKFTELNYKETFVLML